MRALVTGVGGFLGQVLARQLLERGDEVRGFGRGDYPQLSRLGVELVRGDLRDRDAVMAACRDRNVVYHVGGVAGIWGSWAHFYAPNVLGTQHVVAGCHAHGVSRLVYTSSPSVTFDGVDQVNVGQDAGYARRWLCHYPHSKALAEQWVLAHHDPSRLLTCALRPHLIWGPGDQHLIPRLMDRARRGKLKRVGDGRNQIDTIYVDNAASAHVLACDALQPGARVGGRAYFISQGEPVNCWEWIDQLLALTGLPPVRRHVSARIAWSAGTVLEGIYRVLRRSGEPPMTRFLAAQLSTSHYFDLTPARTDFGYEPTISLAEGMRRLASERTKMAP